MSKLTSRAKTLARVAARSGRTPPAGPDPPLVSVVTATYNWSSVLRHAIESVRAQRYPNWEHIVVGDGCTDDSEQVVRSFGDPRVRWLARGENSGGQSLPNNDGIATARGEYVAYLGHDDLFGPNHLSWLVATARREDASIVHGLIEMIGPPGSGLRWLSGRDHGGGTEAGRWIAPSSLMHRRELAQELGGWRHHEEVEALPDAEFIGRLVASGAHPVGTWAMTSFKFPAAMRPNCYRDKHSHEQAALLTRMRSESGFAYRELARMLAARARNGPDEIARGLIPYEQGMSKGEWVRRSRRLRGLDP